MNVFWLDLDPMLSARYACDQHIVKMPTEHAQMLLTALHELGFGTQPMKPIHRNKQLMQWVMADFANFAYLYELTREYYIEYVQRYHKLEHGGWFVLKSAVRKVGGLRAIRQAYKLRNCDSHAPTLYSAMREELWLYVTVPPLYMDEQYRRPLHGPLALQMSTVVSCYRDCYRFDKIRFARYRHSRPPVFMVGIAVK